MYPIYQNSYWKKYGVYHLNGDLHIVIPYPLDMDCALSFHIWDKIPLLLRMFHSKLDTACC